MAKRNAAVIAGLILAGAVALAVGVNFGVQSARNSNKKQTITAKDDTLSAFNSFIERPLNQPNRAETTTIRQLLGPKLTVVNLWATWCTPCREEMPEFEAFQKSPQNSSGLHFVGVAIDRAEPVATFIQSIGVTYPIVIDGIGAIETSKMFGNEKMALPFSYVVNAKGEIVKTKLGKLTIEELRAISAK